MDSYSGRNVDLDCNRHGIDSDALCAMNVYKHDISDSGSGMVCLNRASNIAINVEFDYKIRKNVVKHDYKINLIMLK